MKFFCDHGEAMSPAVKIARRLYAALKGLDEAHERVKANPGPAAEEAVEDAEDDLARVLHDLKQWSAEP